MAKKPEPIAPPSQIDLADLGYHAAVLEQMQAAQAAAQSWSRYLAGKYQLSQADSVDVTGAIVRAESTR